MGLFNKHTRAKMYWRFKKTMKSMGPGEYQLDETQQNVLKITRSIIFKPETEFFDSPVECLTYIHWDHITIKINYEENKLIMMNGKYYYYFNLPSDSINDLIRKIKKVTSVRTINWEKQFTNNTLVNLHAILAEVKDK
jgi:hypothetical protein